MGTDENAPEEKSTENGGEPSPQVAVQPPRPGEIPEPREKSWDSEPADPYEGIDRSDPFEGRPKTKVPQLDQAASESLDSPAPGPGQPLPRRRDEDIEL